MPPPTNDRLIRLEDMFRPIGCEYCRRWNGTILRDESGKVTRPETCPHCGRTVPATLIVDLVAIDLDAI